MAQEKYSKSSQTVLYQITPTVSLRDKTLPLKETEQTLFLFINIVTSPTAPVKCNKQPPTSTPQTKPLQTQEVPKAEMGDKPKTKEVPKVGTADKPKTKEVPKVRTGDEPKTKEVPKVGMGINQKQKRCSRWGQGTNPKQRRCPRWGRGTNHK